MFFAWVYLSFFVYYSLNRLIEVCVKMDKETLKLVARLTFLGYSISVAKRVVEAYDARDRLPDLERIVESAFRDRLEALEVAQNVSSILPAVHALPSIPTKSTN